jgi:GT2 family glycosyltransferase
MTIAVIILTYNRKALLKRCLDSIFRDVSRLPDELVIVNAGTEDVESILDGYKSSGVSVKTVKAPNKSLADNRNAGVMAAASDLVAFTDDDCTVREGWLRTFEGVFTGPDAVTVGSAGGISVDMSGSWLAHNMEEISLMLEDYYNRRDTPYCGYFVTRNACYSKKALEAVGYFTRNYRKSYEDVDIGLKMLAAGKKNVYCPLSAVEHYGRSGVNSVFRRFFQYGRDMNTVVGRFKGLRPTTGTKAEKPALYIFLSTFAGPVRDVGRFWREKNPFTVLVASFFMKAAVNAGMLYERFFGRGTEQ